MGKSPKSKQYDLRKRKKVRKESSSESDPDFSDEELDEDYMDEKEYTKFLSKLFPSKHMSKRIKEMDEIDKKMDEEERKNKKINTKNRRKKVEESEVEDSDMETSEGEWQDEDSDEEFGDNHKINIVFTIGDGLEYEESEDENDTDDSMECGGTEDEEDEDENQEEEIKTKEFTKEDKAILDQFLETTKELGKKYENSTLVKDFQKYGEIKTKEYKKYEDKGTKKIKKKNTERFKKALKKKNVRNDISFFRKLEIERQEKIIKELNSINSNVNEDPYRLQILEANMQTKFKAIAMKKINNLRQMESNSGEYYKIKNWVDTFMQIPFGKYKHLDITINDGVEKCHEFMECSKKILDDAVFGLNDAKMQIMQMIGQWITNPNAIGSAIAIKGPPGTGKTTLVKEGISKILNRDFAFIALGGATDSSSLEGHGYTYEGSTWGKIVDILIQTKCMNPVIYFDELDKISDTPKGEEIVGILTHLTDTTQNSQFHDKYFAEIDFDLSKCLFIFSYNDESKINPILKDRMYRIQTEGYNQKEKATIALTYMLPKIREQVKFSENDIEITDDILKYIISTYTGEEKGVRNLKRCLEVIYTKLNLYRLMKPGINLFEKDMTLEVKFPLKLTREIIDKLIKNPDKTNLPLMYS